MEAPEEVLLDVNELAKGHKFTRVGLMDVSPDGSKLAYTVDFTGFRQYTLHVKDLASGKLLRDTAERVTSAAWAADNTTLFYVEEDETTKRSFRSIGHTLEGGPAWSCTRGRTSSTTSRAAIRAARNSSCSHHQQGHDGDARPADRRSAGRLPTVVPRKSGHEYYLDHRGDEFFIRTNDRGRNFRLVAHARSRSPRRRTGSRSSRTPAGDARGGRPLQGLLGDGRARQGPCSSCASPIRERRAPLHRVRRGGVLGASGVNASSTRAASASSTRASSRRARGTTTTCERTRKLLKRQPVLGGYDPTQYASEALTAMAKDGTRIPISLVYRKSLRRTGPQPLLLYGYGSYGIPMDPNFRSSRISLLDRGMIFAIAHIRGGGDRGSTWYDDGKLLKKKNTFSDFVAWRSPSCAASTPRPTAS
jgi:oligopeptidase B